MKACIAAIVLLSILSGVAFFASGALTGKADRIAEAAEALSAAPQEQRIEACRDIQQLWEDEQFFFSLTLSHTEIDALENALARLCAAANTKGDNDFLIAASELRAAISHIRDLCAVSLDNIL